MDKTYQPGAIEGRWYQWWQQQGFFNPKPIHKPSQDAQTPKVPNHYCIMIPPPNVTGTLHMGHAFQNTLIDTLIRYHRMQGNNTLWQVGTDHAGIATQLVVERQLLAEGISRHELGRETFIDRVWQWKAASGGTITQQLRRLGASVDWSRERFTMDEGLSNAVKEVFVRLHDEGLIYRGKRLVNWDPKLHTAISDLEVENVDQKGSLWHFRYPLANEEVTSKGENYLIVATTRPETFLGDSAVAVHPEDERYQSLIGKTVLLPWVNREIPIVADDYVDPEFGTGCVKITPAHDFNDYELGKRQDLPLINVFDLGANILEKAEFYTTQGKKLADQGQILSEADQFLPEKLRGLNRYDARKHVVAWFEAEGLLEKIEPHALKVPVCERTGEVVEPLLTDQWYVSIQSLAQPAIEVVEKGQIEFVPKQYENLYFAWMRDIEDWCISRQLWWGHRIPAWYDTKGQVYVGRSEQEVRQQHQLGEEISLTQDDDVLDTWFSSALWTFSTLGWPENTEELQAFHPTSVLVTGWDIIFFWVARMIMMTLKFTGQVPFNTVYIHGLIKDAEGQKMSKSKGNVLDPLDVIDGIDLDSLLAKRTSGTLKAEHAKRITQQTKEHFPEGIDAYGTDALRFTFMAMATTGRDINFDVKRLEGYRNFCNKLWNAARYVKMNCENQDTGLGDEPLSLSLADRWILSELSTLMTEMNKAFASYRMDWAAQKLYEFVWNNYCDWYLELSKPVLWDESATLAAKRGTRHTLVRVLDHILRLAHPIIPFITEEIWQTIKSDAGQTATSVMLTEYPQAQDAWRDPEAELDAKWLQGVILSIRTIRGELNISPAKAIPVVLRLGADEDRRRFSENRDSLIQLAKLERLEYSDESEEVPMSAVQVLGTLEIRVPMAGLIDKNQELQRLQKAVAKSQTELSRVKAKLSNERFVSKAPRAVVEKEQSRLNDVQIELNTLKAQVAKIECL